MLDRLVAKQVLGARRRPPVARARAVRLPAGAAADGRLRHAVAAGAEGTSSCGSPTSASDSWPGEARDIAEVLASHYLEAIRAEPDADDVAELRASACETLARAGRAAASLALGPEAQRYLEQAAELAENDLQRAELARAGRACAAGERRPSTAPSNGSARAIELHERSGTSLGGSAAVALASCCAIRVASMRRARCSTVSAPRRAADRSGHPRRGVGRAGRHAGLRGHDRRCVGPLIEEALSVLEDEQAWAPLASALISRAVYLVLSHRDQEGYGVLRHALALADATTCRRSPCARASTLQRSRSSSVALPRRSTRSPPGSRLRESEATDSGSERCWDSRSLRSIMLGRWSEATPLAGPLLGGELDVDAAFRRRLPVPARRRARRSRRCSRAAGRWPKSAGTQSHVDLRGRCRHRPIARSALERGQTRPLCSRSPSRCSRLARWRPRCVDELLELSIEGALTNGDEAADGGASGLPRRAATRSSHPAAPRRSSSARSRARTSSRGRGDGGRGRGRRELLLRKVGARPRLAQALARARATARRAAAAWPRRGRSTRSWVPPAGSSD